MSIFCFIVNIASATTPASLTKAEYQLRLAEARLMSLAITTCVGTYTPNAKAPEYAYLKDSGWTITPYQSTKDKVESNFMIATNPHANMGIIAFRGSHSLGDWKQDFTFDQINFGGTTPEEFETIAKSKAGDKNTPKVHRGFNNYVTAALALKSDIDGDKITDDIVEKLKTTPDFRLLITGHSLGGAAAILYGERLAAMGVNKEQIPVIVFGAPNVGNKAFAEKYGNAIDLLRVETTMDPVPMSLKLLGSKYQDFGKVLKLRVSRMYTDNFHDPAFYYDYGLKHYYELLDQGVALGYDSPAPTRKTTSSVPLVALVLAETKKYEDDSYIPDSKRFILDEYRAVLPSYVILPDKALDNDWETGKMAPLLASAQKAGAQYLIFAHIGRNRIAQGESRYVQLSQTILSVPNGDLVSSQEASSNVILGRGITQCAIKNFLTCKEELAKHKLI